MKNYITPEEFAEVVGHHIYSGIFYDESHRFYDYSLIDIFRHYKELQWQYRGVLGEIFESCVTDFSRYENMQFPWCPNNEWLKVLKDLDPEIDMPVLRF